jgi:hypothetical protein
MPQASGKPAPRHSDLQGIEHLMLSHFIRHPTERALPNGNYFGMMRSGRMAVASG